MPFEALLKNATAEATIFSAILFSRGFTVPKLMTVIGLAYLFGPYDIIAGDIPIWGHVDEVSIAVLSLVLTRLTASRELSRSPVRTPRPRRDAAQSRLASAIVVLRSNVLANWLAVQRWFWRARRGLPNIAGRLQSHLKDAGSAPSLRRAAFKLLGYRLWWSIRSPFAPAASNLANIVVIGGAPRSGTTLLRSILGRHPLIAAAPETTVFLHRVSSPADIAGRLGWSADDIEEWQQRSRSQSEFIERFAAATLRKSGKSVWAEKTPHNVFRFGFVRRRFPNAKLVHIIRDGRDVVCSLRREPFAKAENKQWDSTAAALRCALQWRAAVKAGISFRNDPQYHEVKYEDLVRQPEPTLRSLLAFLRLPWDENLLRSPEIPVSGDHHETKAAGTITVSSVGRWQSDLNAADQHATHQLIGPLIRNLGYSP